MIHALVTSVLDYCKVLCVGLPLGLFWRLRVVQNTAARLLVVIDYHQHVTPVPKCLHWLPT